MAKDKEKNRFYKNKTTLTVYLILRGVIIFVMVRAVFRQEYMNVFLCALSLILMVMPSIIAKKLEIVLPSTLEIIILLFIFAAEILGELNSFYVRVPHWDTMLHTINGFLCAAVGSVMVFSIRDDVSHITGLYSIVSVFVHKIEGCLHMSFIIDH